MSVPLQNNIEKYIHGVSVYEHFLNSIPEDAYFYKPGPGKWSIHDIIIHLTDSEVNGFVRLRKALAENGSAIVAYMQDEWTSKLNYTNQDRSESQRLFRLLREINYKLLRSLKESDWKKTYLHPETGSVTVEKWLEIYTDHLDTHLSQMKRNLESIKTKKIEIKKNNTKNLGDKKNQSKTGRHRKAK